MGGRPFFFFLSFLSRFQFFFFFSFSFLSVPIEIQITSSEGENLGTFYCLAELFCKHDRPSRCFPPTFGEWRPKANLFFPTHLSWDLCSIPSYTISIQTLAFGKESNLMGKIFNLIFGRTSGS